MRKTKEGVGSNTRIKERRLNFSTVEVTVLRTSRCGVFRLFIFCEDSRHEKDD